MEVHERVRRGLHAKSLLDNNEFAAAMAALKEDYVAALAHGPADTNQDQAKLAELRAITALRAKLQSWVDDGEIAKKRLNQ